MRLIAFAPVLLLALIGQLTDAIAQVAPENSAPEVSTGTVAKQLVTAKHSMVVAAHPLAVEAGLQMLDAGGSATDAAIAVQLVLNLVEPQSSGIGGGAFILHFDARTQKLSAYDGREEAPADATTDMFVPKDGKPLRYPDSFVGGRVVGVPGLLRLVEMAHARHGRLPWSVLFAPAIRLAENGYPLTTRTHAQLANDKVLPRLAATREYFYGDDGKPKPIGTLMKNPAFAAVLKQIAKDGPDAFYTGSLASEIVKAVRTSPDNPGTLSEDDLRHYRARTLEPVCGPYRQFRVCGMPPPSAAGVAVLQILGVLARFDMKNVKPDSLEAVHLFSEAGRLAFADRDRYMGDERFTKIPMAGLIDPNYLQTRSQLIKPERSMVRAPAGKPDGAKLALVEGDAPELPSTSHISIVDKFGNAVSMTTSIESSFGSHIFVQGFFLNNQMTDFSLLPDKGGLPVANNIQPGKRPRSAMAPTMVFDEHAGQERLFLLTGSPGGPVIINYVAQNLVATLDWGLDMQAAVSLPHFGSRNGPTELERGTSVEKLSGALQAMGHEIRVGDFNSGLHGIMRTSEGWQAGADPRREGIAKGR